MSPPREYLKGLGVQTGSMSCHPSSVHTIQDCCCVSKDDIRIPGLNGIADDGAL